MPTYVLYPYGGVDDGYYTSNASTFSGAREAASASVSTGTAQLTNGVYTDGGSNWYCYESGLAFDTGSIVDTETVTGAELSVHAVTIGGSPTIQVRADDWQRPLDSADWSKGSVFGANTLLASKAFSATGRQSFTENGTAFADYINVTADTHIMVSDSTFASGTQNGTQYVNFYGADEAGTTNDPTLTVTTTGGGTNATVTAVVAEANADAPAPAVSATKNPTVSAVTAEANADAPAPSVTATQNATVEAVVGAASADAPVPTVSGQANVATTATVAEANADAPAPAVAATTTTNVEVVAVPAEATAAAGTPTIDGGTGVTAVPASATADAPTPTVSAIAASTVLAPVAEATATLPTPSVEGQVPDFTFAVSVYRSGLSADAISGTLRSTEIRGGLSTVALAGTLTTSTARGSFSEDGLLDRHGFNQTGE